MNTKPISMPPWKYIALALAAALSFGSAAQAAIQLNFVYDPVANATTATFSGTWNLAAQSTGTLGYAHRATASDFYSLTAIPAGFFSGGGMHTPYAWESAGNASSYTGHEFGFDSNLCFGPVGFTAATFISGSMTWAGKNLAAMGFSAEEIANGGFYSGAAGTVNWTASNLAMVPEPATYGLMSGGLILGCALMRRRRSCGNA
jgi:hypothetical protein